jgi:hypothetical protein
MMVMAVCRCIRQNKEREKKQIKKKNTRMDLYKLFFDLRAALLYAAQRRRTIIFKR